MDIENEIILAVQRKALKEHLKEHERQKKHKRYIVRLTTFITSVVATAACICGLLVYIPATRNLQKLGDETFNNYTCAIVLQARGDSYYFDLFVEAYSKVEEGDLNDAEKKLMRILSEVKIESSQDTYLINETKWLLAICYMKEGEMRKSKQLLIEISKDDSPHSEEAAKLLQEL